jgi:signal transduction histidine kinase/ActR/RegA family two-component response regulator
MISTHFLSPQRPSDRQLRLLDLLARQAADYLERKHAENLLREYVQQLTEAERRKDEFLATLAHELRNPLAPISNAVQMLKEIGYTDPDLVENQELIERQLQHMVRLLDDLLDVSRITSNKLELRKTQVMLAAVIQSAIETSRLHIDSGAHELSMSLPTEPVYIEGDADRLAQVFSNLLNNAAKFTREGGRIWLSAERQGDEIAVSVKDNGIGIAPEMLPRLFEMFSQAESLYERSHEGLGIGLWLIKGLVEMHGGTITAHSDGLGKGSEFIVRLPVIAKTVTAESSRPDENEEAQRGKLYRILVVDDRKNSADILARLLRKKGHDVQTAYDGKNGLSVAEKFRPEVVLLDIGMPDMNGYEVCRQIRSHPWGTRMYLIAVSGWGQEQDRRRSAEAGFDYHLVKPVHSAMLTKVLDSIKTSSLVDIGSSPRATEPCA